MYYLLFFSPNSQLRIRTFLTNTDNLEGGITPLTTAHNWPSVEGLTHPHQDCTTAWVSPTARGSGHQRLRPAQLRRGAQPQRESQLQNAGGDWEAGGGVATATQPGDPGSRAQEAGWAEVCGDEGDYGRTRVGFSKQLRSCPFTWASTFGKMSGSASIPKRDVRVYQPKFLLISLCC